MRRFLITAVLFVGFVGFFGASIFMQHRALQDVQQNPPFIETWQLVGRSGESIKTATLGYNLLAADFLWLRAIQSFGGRGMTNRDWKPLYNMFDTITELDPYFETAYTFGNLVIGDEGGKQREALELLNKGIPRLVRQYRVPFEGLYVAHWSLGDNNLARWYGHMAMKRQDAPDWIPRMVAFVEVEAGAFYIGFDRFVGNLLQALDAKDLVLEQIAFEKSKETVHKWSLKLIGQAMQEYTTATGHMATKIEDLAGQPSLKDYEIASIPRLLAAIDRRLKLLGRDGVDPILLQNSALPTPEELSAPSPPLSAKEKEEKNMANRQDEVFRESLRKRSGIPPDPYGSRYVFNLSKLGARGAALDDMVSTEKKITEEFLPAMLSGMRKQIDTRKTELGRNPTSLKEVFYTDFKTSEPLGGEWIYNPATAEFKSSSRPNL